MYQTRESPLIVNNEMWIAWCSHCGNVEQFGRLYRTIGWPYCGRCKVRTQKDPRWPGTPWQWVPPEKDAEGVLRVWLEENI